VVRPIQGGAEALALLASETPDLVVLDLMMPEVDGFEVLAQLRGRDQTRLDSGHRAERQAADL